MAVVSFLNSDFKTWNISRIHGRPSNNRSYEILTENGFIISRNRVHLCETNVVFRKCVPTSISIADHVGDACKAEIKAKPLPVPNNGPHLLFLVLKLQKAPLVLMTTVIEHDQAE